MWHGKTDAGARSRALTFFMQFSVPAMVLAWAAGPWTDTIAVKGVAANSQALKQISQSRMFRWRDAKGMLLSGPNNETLSNNWSGYGINGGDTYTTVQGSWTVPAVSYQSYSGSPDVEASSTWIGVGGQDGDETLIQIGTMQAAAPNGETEYFAWYEVLPETEVPISRKQYPVKPGDTITATIQCTAACAPYALSTWVLTLTNAAQLAAAVHDNIAIRLEPDLRRMDHGGPVHQRLRILVARVRLYAQLRLDHVQRDQRQ